MHQYAGQALVTHCRHAVLTQELLADLATFNLAQWLCSSASWADGGSPGAYDAAWADLPHLMGWLKGQVRVLFYFAFGGWGMLIYGLNCLLLIYFRRSGTSFLSCARDEC